MGLAGYFGTKNINILCLYQLDWHSLVNKVTSFYLDKQCLVLSRDRNSSGSMQLLIQWIYGTLAGKEAARAWIWPVAWWMKLAQSLGLLATGWMIGIFFTVQVGFFNYHVHNSSGTHTASYPFGTGGWSSQIMKLTTHLHLVPNAGRFTSFPLYAFMAWCLDLYHFSSHI
jgi:hypothetical protein